MTTINAILVMLLARQIGLSIRMMSNADTAIIAGKTLKAIFLYSPIIFSVRAISVFINAEGFVLYSASKLESFDLVLK